MTIGELITICRKVHCNMTSILNSLIELDNQSNKNTSKETFIDVEQLTVEQFLKKCFEMNCMPKELLKKSIFSEDEKKHLSTLEKEERKRVYTLIGKKISSKRKKLLKFSKRENLTDISYTQEGLSTYLWKNTKYINNIENCKVENINVLELIDICNALSCTPDDLLKRWILKNDKK